jgi:hypothetical protein
MVDTAHKVLKGLNRRIVATQLTCQLLQRNMPHTFTVNFKCLSGHTYLQHTTSAEGNSILAPNSFRRSAGHSYG